MTAPLSTPIADRGDWMQTYTGRQFWPLDPDPAAIAIVDIAHALGNACRYAGHALRFYSVAEHCVLMARAVAPEHRRWALLHDASEAYIVDVPRPLKPHLTNYRALEAGVMVAVVKAFGLDPETMPAAVHDADNRILHDELAQNMAPPPVPWALPGKPLGVTLQFWTPRQAEEAFLAAWLEVSGA